MFGKKKKPEEYPDIRQLYDPAYFNGRSLNTDKHQTDLQLLWNLLKQGEVHRLDTKEQLADIATSLKQLVEVQSAVLNELRKQSGGA